MRFRDGERPPPQFADDDLSNERFPGRLNEKFNPHKRSAQRAQPIPRERLAYLARQSHPLGERALHELFIELEAGGKLGPVLEQYARIAPLAGFVAAMGGDQLPPARLIRGRRA